MIDMEKKVYRLMKMATRIHLTYSQISLAVVVSLLSGLGNRLLMSYLHHRKRRFGSKRADNVVRV